MGLTIILAYYIFSQPAITAFFSTLGHLSYPGIFIAGLLFSFGFTTPFAIGLFIAINPSNIYLAAILGGFGALISDLLIFSIIKISFQDEFERLEKTKFFKKISNLIKNNINAKLRFYLLYIFAGFVIASPLPDEIGVTMLAGLGHIRPLPFAILSLIFNTLGILFILNL